MEIVRLFQINSHCQLLRHIFAYPVKHSSVGRISFTDTDPVPVCQFPDLRIDIGNLSIFYFYQSSSDIQTTGSLKIAFPEGSNIAGASSDIDIGHCLPLFFRELVCPCASGGKHRLQIRPCRSHYKLSGHTA